jgi:hypothetical protein
LKHATRIPFSIVALALDSSSRTRALAGSAAPTPEAAVPAAGPEATVPTGPAPSTPRRRQMPRTRAPALFPILDGM